MKRWKIKKAGIHKLISDREFPFDIIKIKQKILEKLKRYGSFESDGWHWVSFDNWLDDLEGSE